MFSGTFLMSGLGRNGGFIVFCVLFRSRMKHEGYKHGVDASKNVVSSAMCQSFDVMGEAAEVPYSNRSLFHDKVHSLRREGALAPRVHTH